MRCACNCMPEEGVRALKPAGSQAAGRRPDIVLLSSLFVSQGVTKIRPHGQRSRWCAADIVPADAADRRGPRVAGLRELCLTTSGLCASHRKSRAHGRGRARRASTCSLDTLDPVAVPAYDAPRRVRRPCRKSIDCILELKRAGAAIGFKYQLRTSCAWRQRRRRLCRSSR